VIEAIGAIVAFGDGGREGGFRQRVIHLIGHVFQGPFDHG
jgi:hypothetical protein